MQRYDIWNSKVKKNQKYFYQLVSTTDCSCEIWSSITKYFVCIWSWIS